MCVFHRLEVTAGTLPSIARTGNLMVERRPSAVETQCLASPSQYKHGSQWKACMRKEVLCSLACLHAVSTIVLLTIHGVCIAHDDPNAPVPALRALKVDSPLTVDGVLDEPFWQEADVATNFTDVRSGQPADQQTKVRIAYARAHLYIAVECLDDRMAELHATERRKDRFFQGDDWVEIHLDPAHTHNSKYAFFSNPLGTKVHNISLIYGWEFIKDAHLYVVYNNIREEDEPEATQSIFLKLAYTFR